MSFRHTEKEFLSGVKDVTRRLGWRFLVPVETLTDRQRRLRAVRQGMGLKKGESQHVLGTIWVADARFEPLEAIDYDDVAREGFVGWSPGRFIDMFCKMNRCRADTELTRIQFERLDHFETCGHFNVHRCAVYQPNKPAVVVKTCGTCDTYLGEEPLRR